MVHIILNKRKYSKSTAPIDKCEGTLIDYNLLQKYLFITHDVVIHCVLLQYYLRETKFANICCRLKGWQGIAVFPSTTTFCHLFIKFQPFRVMLRLGLGRIKTYTGGGGGGLGY